MENSRGEVFRETWKSDNYSPNSYRPISLTSCLGKIMNRLESYIEGNGLMDAEQEGFRKIVRNILPSKQFSGSSSPYLMDLRIICVRQLSL